MSKSHINSDLQLVGKPVVIDNLSTAYFSFNSSLVSQPETLYPVVDPVNKNFFSGASNGVDGGTQEYDKDLFLKPGKFGYGISCDEYTENVVSAPTIFSSGWTSYTNGNDGSFVTEFGTEGLNIVNRRSWCGAQKSITLPSTGTYTLSVYIKVISRTQPSIGATLYTSGGGISDTAVSASWEPDIIGKWQKVSMTRTYTTTNLGLYLICYGGVNMAGYEISAQYTMPQIEKKEYYTPFVNGTRASSYLTYPPYSPKTISLWIKSTSSKVVNGVSTPRTILRQADYSNNYPQWSLYATNTNSSDFMPGTATQITAGSVVLKTRWKTNGVDVTEAICAVNNFNLLDGNWHHIVCEFGAQSYSGSSTVCRVWIDDQYGETLALTETNFLFNGQLHMGYYLYDSEPTNVENIGNFLIDELRLDKKHYSYDDIRRRYISGTEVYDPYAYGVVSSLGDVIEEHGYTYNELELLPVYYQEQLTWNYLEGED